MTEFLAKALLLLIGAAATGLVTGIGYLVKRHVSRDDPVDRFIAQHERVLAASGGVNQPVREVDRANLEQALLELRLHVYSEDSAHEAFSHMTQADMNRRAAEAADRDAADVTLLLHRLRAKLKPADHPALAEAQRAWERYADLEARIGAEPFVGGTIMPTIYHGDRSVLARSRAADLRRVIHSYEL